MFAKMISIRKQIPNGFRWWFYYPVPIGVESKVNGCCALLKRGSIELFFSRTAKEGSPRSVDTIRGPSLERWSLCCKDTLGVRRFWTTSVRIWEGTLTMAHNVWSFDQGNCQFAVSWLRLGETWVIPPAIPQMRDVHPSLQYTTFLRA